MTLINNKLLKRLLILIISSGILAYLILNENGLLKFFRVESEINNLNNEIKKAEIKLKELESEIDSLNTSKVKKEKVARERYNMMKKSEKVFKIDEN